MRYEVVHSVRYSFAEGAQDAVMAAIVQPADWIQPGRRDGSILVRPAPIMTEAADDPFGNARTSIRWGGPIASAQIQMVNVVDLDGSGRGAWEPAADPFADPHAEQQLLGPTRLVPADPKFVEIASRLDIASGSAEAAADRVSAWLAETLAYRPGATRYDTTASQALEIGAGVCQDFAHVALAVLRAAGRPAAYVSGYLFSPERSRPAGPGARTEWQKATHAWCALHVGGGSWHVFDPLVAGSSPSIHLAMAFGRDFDDVVPVRLSAQAVPANPTTEVAITCQG